MYDHIYDSRNIFYKSKFGAVNSDEGFDLKLVLPQSIQYPKVNVVFKNNNGEKTVFPLSFVENINYKNIFKGCIPPMPVGIYFYYFDVITDTKSFGVFKTNYFDTIAILADEGYWYQLTVYDKNFSTPNFLKGKIIYQIFPDRFNYSGKAKSLVPSDRRLHGHWGCNQDFLPNENGEYLNDDYFCGDLLGIEQKLDYLHSLGVGCIYLNPIFESHSNHRYDTANYMKIDPLLGTNDDFISLCKKARQLGIEIILDGVFSHVGSDSIYFNSKNRYEGVGAYNSDASPYYNWFTFQEYPKKYSCWWGFVNLPEVNELNPDFSDYICKENGVIDYWIKLGAKGFRLDVCDELPGEFLKQIRTSVKKSDNENILIGEVWEDASNKESYGKLREYLLGHELDSVMNYPFMNAILEFVKFKNAKLFKDKIMTIIENYPKPSIDVTMNMLSTHDTVRALTFLAGDDCQGKDRIWQYKNFLSPVQLELGIKMLKVSMVLQYFLPGVPCIYYGDEVGVSGYKDPFNRKCFPWGYENNDLLEFTQKLGKIRRNLDVLSDGECRIVYAENGILTLERFLLSQKVAVTVDVNNYTYNIKQG